MLGKMCAPTMVLPKTLFQVTLLSNPSFFGGRDDGVCPRPQPRGQTRTQLKRREASYPFLLFFRLIYFFSRRNRQVRGTYASRHELSDGVVVAEQVHRLQRVPARNSEAETSPASRLQRASQAKVFHTRRLSRTGNKRLRFASSSHLDNVLIAVKYSANRFSKANKKHEEICDYVGATACMNFQFLPPKHFHLPTSGEYKR